MPKGKTMRDTVVVVVNKNVGIVLKCKKIFNEKESCIIHESYFK